jgi:hypothetical protein
MVSTGALGLRASGKGPRSVQGGHGIGGSKMRKYKFIKVWAVLHNISKDGPAPAIGEVIEVQLGNGEILFKEVDSVSLFVSKKGEQVARMFVKADDE